MNVIVAPPHLAAGAGLNETDWQSRSIKTALCNSVSWSLATGDERFSGIAGYGDTVNPEINASLLAGHDSQWLGLNTVRLQTIGGATRC